MVGMPSVADNRCHGMALLVHELHLQFWSVKSSSRPSHIMRRERKSSVATSWMGFPTNVADLHIPYRRARPGLAYNQYCVLSKFR